MSKLLRDYPLSLFRMSSMALCLLLLTNCAHFQNLRSKDTPNEPIAKREDSETEGAAKTKEDEKPEVAEEKSKDAPEAKADLRMVKNDNTPFFRFLRSGLRAGSTPSDFLTAGTKVELLKEDDQAKFSRIRLANKRTGWVPSRLLTLLPNETTEVPEPATTSTTETTPDGDLGNATIAPETSEAPDPEVTPPQIDPANRPGVVIPEIGVE